jgi:phage gp29-like protein
MKMVERIVGAVKRFAAGDQAPDLPVSQKGRLALPWEPVNLSSTATVASIQGALRTAERGDTRQLFSIYRDLTAGGSHIQAEFNKRKMAILAQPMSCLPQEKGKKEDMAAAAACMQAVQDCENWSDGLTHLLDGCLWPVAVSEKIFRPVDPSEPGYKLGLRYTLKRLEPVNMQLLCFRGPWFGMTIDQGSASQANPKDQWAYDPLAWEPDLKFWGTDERGRILYQFDTVYAADKVRHLVHRGHMLVGLRDCWGGPMRAVVFWWLLSTLGRDWFARAMERFGVPFPVGHTDAKNQEAIDFLNQAFSLATKIGGLVVDHETQVDLKEVMISGLADAHEKFLSICNREISKVIVGQTLSAEAQSTGLGSGTSKLQGDVREDIRMFDQMRLGETVQKQLFAQLLQINGLTGSAPKLVWGGLSDEDAKTLAELLELLSRAGLEPTDEALPTINERLGFEVRRKVVVASNQSSVISNQSSVIGNQSSVIGNQSSQNGESKNQNGGDGQVEGLSAAWVSPRARARFAALSAQAGMADAMGVPAGWLNPLRDFLEELQAKAADKSLSDRDLIDFLEQAARRVPELFREMDIEELAKVLEAGMGKAVVDGVRQELRKLD